MQHRPSHPHAQPAAPTIPAATSAVEDWLWAAYDAAIDGWVTAPPEIQRHYRGDVEVALAAAQALVVLLRDLNADIEGYESVRLDRRRLRDLGPDDPWSDYEAAGRCEAPDR